MCYGTFDLLVTYSTLLLPLVNWQLDQGLFRFMLDYRGNKEEQGKLFSTLLLSSTIQSIIYIILFVCVEPFLKIQNAYFLLLYADDYYGKEGFKAVHEYLVNGGKSCMAGFVLKNTLSDNGGVTRGICKMDDQNNLTEVVETKNIVKTATGAETDGLAVDVNSLVSMNMWGLTPDLLRLGTFQLSDIFYNTVGGVIGGLMYCAVMKAKKRL